MSIPTDISYTADHEWVRFDTDVVVVGITEYAAEALGDVVYLELPEPGASITAGSPCGEVESTKSVSDLLAPGNGEVTEINESAVASPDVVNSDPYGAGWLFKARLTETPDLLDATAYAHLVGEES